MSIVGLIMGPLVEVIHLKDWWNPNFIFNSFIRIEDILFGFSFAGVASATYLILSSKKIGNMKKSESVFYKIIVSALTPFLLFGLFFLFHFTSFWSSIIAMSLNIILICNYRSQFISEMLLTGFFILIIAVPGYFFGVFIYPGWIQAEWLVNHLSGITINTVPIEEFIWFLFAGTNIAALQALWSSDLKSDL